MASIIDWMRQKVIVRPVDPFDHREWVVHNYEVGTIFNKNPGQKFTVDVIPLHDSSEGSCDEA